MSPEEYAALKAEATVKLFRDAAGNFLYEAATAKLGVLPRDIIDQLNTMETTAIKEHEAKLTAIATFRADLKAAK